MLVKMRLRAALLHVKQRAVKVLERHLSGESMDFRQVFAIIVPLLMDQAFIILLALLNTAMISASGEAAVAAVGMVDSLNIFIFNVFIALATGGTVIVAQYRGAGNSTAFSKAAAQTIAAVSLISFIIGLTVSGFHSQILSFLFGKAEQAVIDNARLYLIGSSISYTLVGVIEAVGGALRGVGATKATLWLSLIKNGTYVLFNVIFLNVLKMGVWGLVYSLLASRLLGMVCSLIYMRMIHNTIVFRFKDVIRLDFSMLKRILFIGIPFAAEQMFFNGGKLLTQTFIVLLGTNALTVNAICSSLSTLPQVGVLSCNLAAITVIGQCIGNRNYNDARKFVRSFLVLGSLSVVVIILILLPFLPSLIGLFSPSPTIIPSIKIIIYITWAATPLLWPASFITPSALRAAGDARFTLIAALTTMWLIRVVLGYVLGIILPFGITGVWIAMIIEWGVRSLIFHIRFRGGKWRNHNLLG